MIEKYELQVSLCSKYPEYGLLVADWLKEILKNTFELGPKNGLKTDQSQRS